MQRSCSLPSACPVRGVRGFQGARSPGQGEAATRGSPRGPGVKQRCGGTAAFLQPGSTIWWSGWALSWCPPNPRGRPRPASVRGPAPWPASWPPGTARPPRRWRPGARSSASSSPRAAGQPPGAAVAAGLHAAARARRAAPAAARGVLHAQHALQLSPHASPIHAPWVGPILP